MSTIPSNPPRVNVSPAVHRVLAKLNTVRRTGSGWSATCPAHDDSRASLSIAAGRDGRALLHCHGGCPITAVLDAMGLRFADLFATPRHG